MSKPTPRTDALTHAHYQSACADAAGMGTEVPCELAYGEVCNLARQLERDLAAELAKVEEVTAKVRRIHEVLKRGKDTQDHGLMMNLDCILDHIVDAAIAEGERHEQ